jgi:phage tail-like protein
MPLADGDSAVGHSFGCEIDGVVTQLREVAGLTFEQDVIELKENTPDGGFVIRKLPGRFKPGEVTLTRGLTHDNTFGDWIGESVSAGADGAHRSAAIIVYDDDGTEIKRYGLHDARPISLEVGTTKSGDTSLLTEKLVIGYRAVDVG